MDNKVKGLLLGASVVLNLIGVAGLTGFALKQRNERYKVESKLVKAQCDIFDYGSIIAAKDEQIQDLKRQIEDLKKEDAVTQEET